MVPKPITRQEGQENAIHTHATKAKPESLDLFKNPKTKPVIGYFPDDYKRFPETPEQAQEKIRNLRKLIAYLPEMAEIPADTNYHEWIKETAQRVDRYFKKYGVDALRILEHKFNEGEKTPIEKALENTVGVRITPILDRRQPLCDADFIRQSEIGKTLKNTEVGDDVARFLNSQNGSPVLVGDSDIMMAAVFQAAKKLLEAQPDARIGAVVLDSHGDFYSCSRICKANSLGYSLGFVERGLVDDVKSFDPSLHFAALIGMPSDSAWRTDNETRRRLYAHELIAIYEDNRFYDEDGFNPSKLKHLAPNILHNMQTTGKDGFNPTKPITHLVFHVDTDILPREHHFGFEYNVLELLSKRKSVDSENPDRAGNEYMAISDAVQGIGNHEMRGIPANAILDFIHHTSNLARDAGIQVGIPTEKGRFMLSIGEFVPEWDTGGVKDFILRAARYTNRQYEKHHARQLTG